MSGEFGILHTGHSLLIGNFDSTSNIFKITKSADLFVKCFDTKDEFLGEYNLGNIF